MTKVDLVSALLARQGAARPEDRVGYFGRHGGLDASHPFAFDIHAHVYAAQGKEHGLRLERPDASTLRVIMTDGSSGSAGGRVLKKSMFLFSYAIDFNDSFINQGIHRWLRTIDREDLLLPAMERMR